MIVDDEKLLNVRELAERLGFTEEWVHDHVTCGDIPVIRFNSRAWRFHWATVLQALQKMR